MDCKGLSWNKQRSRTATNEAIFLCDGRSTLRLNRNVFLFSGSGLDDFLGGGGSVDRDGRN
ncbi:MAG: hypothetical protein WBF45_06030, partial [Acidobacteriaceae bacterium]